MAVRETLELDISPAERAVSELAASLERSLREAMSNALDQTFEAKVEGDASDVQNKTTEAVADADTEAELTGDASAIPGELEGEIARADTEAELTGDASSVAPELEGAIAGADTDVQLTVTADTSQAEAAIADLSGEAEQAVGPMGGLGDSMTGAGAAGGLLAGGAGRATAALGKLGPVGIAAGAAIGGATTASGFFYNQARENVEITETWEQRLGPLGDRILDLGSGTTGFTGNIRDLAQQLGSSDEAVLQATQRFAEWQLATGATDEAVADMTQQVVVLAAQIRANNPQLGTMDEIVTALTRGITRGGARMRIFGLDIDQTKIKARALELGLGNATGELSDQEKAIAGLSLANEQLRPTQDKVNEGAEQTAIKIGAASEKFGDALEEIGKPLVAPVNEVLFQMASLFEEVVKQVGPVVTALGTEFARAASAASRAIAFVRENLNRLMVGPIPLLIRGIDRLTGSFDLASVFVKGFVNTALTSIPVIGPMVKLLSGLSGGLGDSGENAEASTAAIGELDDLMNQFGGTVGGTTDEVEAFDGRLVAAGQTLSAFVSGVSQSIPSVAAAFGELSAEKGTTQILAELDGALAGTQQWTDEMQRQIEGGNTNIVNLMAQLGPEKSRILLESYGGELADLEAHLNRLAFAEMAARVTAREMAVRQYLDMQGIVGAQQDAIVEEVRSRLVLEDPTVEAIQAAAAAVDVDTSLPSSLAAAAGRSVQGWATALKLDTPTSAQLVAIANLINLTDLGTPSQAMAEAAVARYNATLPGMEQFTNEQIAALVAIMTGAPLEGAGGEAGGNVASGFAGGVAPTAAAAGQAARDAEGAIRRETGTFFATGGRLADQFATGIRLRVNTVRRAGADTGRSARDGLVGAAPATEFFIVGGQTAEGFARGIRSRAGEAADEAARMVREAARRAREEAETDSPSRLFAAIGDDIGAGLALGMERQTGTVADAARQMLAAADQAADVSFVAGGTTLREVSIQVPVTVTGGVTADEGRQFGEQVAGEVSRQLVSTLRLEGLVA